MAVTPINELVEAVKALNGEGVSRSPKLLRTHWRPSTKTFGGAFDNSWVDRRSDHTGLDHRAAEGASSVRVGSSVRCRELEPRILAGSDVACEAGGGDFTLHDEIPGYFSPSSRSQPVSERLEEGGR